MAPKPKTTIVKVQWPIFSFGGSVGAAEVMVYNKDKSLSFVIDAVGSEYMRIKKAMKGKDKAFFYACTHCEQADFDRPAPYQGW